MSSATPSESVELDPKPVEPPPSAPGTAAGETESERVAEETTHDDRPRWRQVAGRVPIELAIIALLAVVTRFAFLYDPRAIVFDEIYFREFALRYQEGTYYFDLHPPLGKLILGAW